MLHGLHAEPFLWHKRKATETSGMISREQACRSDRATVRSAVGHNAT
jgi:hypothetical protein